MKTLSFLIICLIIATFGCSQSTFSPDRTKNEVDDSYTIYKLDIRKHNKFDIPAGVLDSNIIGYLTLNSWKYETRSIYNSIDTMNITFNECQGFFSDNHIGDVLFNEDTMEFGCKEVVDNIYTEEPNCSYGYDYRNLSFNEQDITWKGSGNEKLPPFTLLMTVPASMSYITSPEPGQKVKYGQPLTIKWNGNHQPGVNIAKIKIISDYNDYADRIEYSIQVEDNGSYTIPADIMKQFEKKNGFDIELCVGKNKLQEIIPGKYFYSEIYNEHNINCYFSN